MTLSPRSGSYDVNTPVDARGYLLPSTQERIQYLRAEVERLQKRRAVLCEQLGSPVMRNIKRYKNREFLQKLFPPEVLKEYFEVGELLNTYNREISLLNTHLQQTTDESFETMFVRAAKNMLPSEEFNRLKHYTHMLMDELAKSVCLPEDYMNG